MSITTISKKLEELPSEKYKKNLFEKAGKDGGRLKITLTEKKEYERLKKLEKPMKKLIKNKDEKKIFKVGDMISDSYNLSKINNIGKIVKVNKNDYIVNLMTKREYKKYNDKSGYMNHTIRLYPFGAKDEGEMGTIKKIDANDAEELTQGGDYSEYSYDIDMMG
jgi:hypothetical protein